MASGRVLLVVLAITVQTLSAQRLPVSSIRGSSCGEPPLALSSISLVKETLVYPPGSCVVSEPCCGCNSSPCGCYGNYGSIDSCCDFNPCRCNPNPCDCLSCGCKQPCSCNQELILPPLFPQLPCGCGFSESAIPLVASAYGSSPFSCGTFVEPYYTSECGCGNNCGYAEPLVSLSLSGNGCGCGLYPGFGVPSVSYVLPSCGCGTANACGCGTPGSCGGGCGCGLTLATPVCPNLAAMAVPIIL